MSDTAVISVAGAGVFWSVSLDLERGVAVRIQEGKRGEERPISEVEWVRLRAEARAAHALGDITVREQFADGATIFELTVGGITVTQSYEDCGGGRYKPTRWLWDYALGVRAGKLQSEKPA